MIILYILFAILLTIAATIVTMVSFGYQRNKHFRKFLFSTIVVGLIVGSFCLVYGGIVSGEVAELQADYDNLMLYYNTVNNSTNEYVRYDYYEKVLEYNEEFASHKEASAGEWLGGLYPRNWANNIGLIDFQLHGDNYVG